MELAGTSGNKPVFRKNQQIVVAPMGGIFVPFFLSLSQVVWEKKLK